MADSHEAPTLPIANRPTFTFAGVVVARREQRGADAPRPAQLPLVADGHREEPRAPPPWAPLGAPPRDPTDPHGAPRVRNVAQASQRISFSGTHTHTQ